MECAYKGSMRHPTTGMWHTYPCGRCLGCRVTRQSSWELRNHLECQAALSKQFWTLTFNDESLPVLAEVGPRALSRRFFDGLRRSEIRAGNSAQIRYFGCFEHGTLSGRPHYHFLLYNMAENIRTPTMRTDGLPSERHHIGFWPHGHIDIGQITKSSIRYVAKYLTTFEPAPELRSITISTSRPAIGYYGLELLAENLAQRRITLPCKPAFFQLGQRAYPLDQWTRNTFEKLLKRKGVDIGNQENPYDRKLSTLSLNAAKDEMGFEEKLAERYQEKEREIERSNAKTAETKLSILERYNRIRQKATDQSAYTSDEAAYSSVYHETVEVPFFDDYPPESTSGD